MSFFKSITDAITAPFQMVSNALGSGLNSITGATSAAKKSQKYSLQSMAVQNAYEKEAAQNAHQWEVQDLEEAGLNPILSAGGKGAQADTGISAGSQQGSGLTPLDLLQSLTSASKTMKELGLIGKQEEKINAEINNVNADTANKIEENPFIGKRRKAEIAIATAQERESKSRTKLNSAKTVSEEGDWHNWLGGMRNEIKNSIPTEKENYKHASESYKKNRAWFYKN